ncbi:MAG: shikimate kinase [Oscillospiraceae bacterium]|nr:shikimate kinase [Oscillospiraceae bacterium]
MEYGLLGEKLGHSFSPQLHKALAGYDYQLIPTPPNQLKQLFSKRNFRGLNVTIPYKQTVIPLCDEVDETALQIGAVNTVVNRNGRLIGYNTDLDGLIYLARSADVALHGKKVLILGSGGTSRTAQTAAKLLGAAEIVVISRSGENNYQTLHRHTDAQVIINTTPVGMFPDCGTSPVSLEAFPNLTGVLDVVYNPLRTALYLQASARSIPCACGLPMLAAQAKRAAELFTDTSIPDSHIEDVLIVLRRQLENIVLIGMPGCGKSSIGQALAKKLGRKWIDLDSMIEECAGKSIPEIFAQDGETTFRMLETQYVQKAGAQTGCVISTGGGVVTRTENYAPLHQNGIIIHLTRDITSLPKEGRPISQRTDLRQLWQNRKALYERFADLTIDNNTTLPLTVERITQELNYR